jgi:hypothetical protein
VKGFGPHELAVSCVADRLRQDRWLIDQRLDPIPKKSDSRLLAACEDVPRISPRGMPVVALVDDDRIRRPLKLTPHTLKREVAAIIRNRTATPGQLIVCLLDRNIETLVKSAALRLDVRGAIVKRPIERDRILGKAAHATPDVRAALCGDVPTFGCFVDGLARLCACP